MGKGPNEERTVCAWKRLELENENFSTEIFNNSVCFITVLIMHATC